MFTIIGEQRIQEDNQVAIWMDLGKWGHLRWQVAGLSEGFLTHAEIKIGHGDVWGHVDGFVADGSGFELKTVSDRHYTSRLANGPHEDHLLQIQTYMYLTNLDTFSLVYESRDDGAFFEYRVHKHDGWQAKVDQMLTSMLKHKQQWDISNELPPVLRVCAKGSGKVFDACRFRDICLGYVVAKDRGDSTLESVKLP